MTEVAVIVPWRPTPEREPLWGSVKPVWQAIGWPVVEVDDGGVEFSRAASLNLGARISSADVFVFADADTVPDIEAVQEAVRAAGDGRLHLPFTQAIVMQERGYEVVEYSVGGINILSRQAFETVGGFDNRFRGWGFEDNAFAHRCERALGPLVRHVGIITSLYHPPCWKPNDETYRRNQALWKEYDHS